VIPFRRYSTLIKPGLGATLNPGHPLAQNMVAAWLFNEMSGTKAHSLINANDDLAFQGTTAWSTTVDAYGVYMPVNGNGLLLSSPSAGLKPSSAVSMFCRFNVNGGGSLTNNPAICELNGAVQPAYSITRRSGDGTALAVFDTMGGNNSLITTGLINASLGGPYTAGITLGQSSGKLFQYFKGRQVNSAARSGTMSYSSPTFLVGCAFNFTTASINIDVVYVYNRELSAAEMLWLHTEPYAPIAYDTPLNRAYFGAPFLDASLLGGDAQIPQLLPQ
jgi:hypothetical protein